jgi:phosphate starvation-inducible PhoH-like protein
LEFAGYLKLLYSKLKIKHSGGILSEIILTVDDIDLLELYGQNNVKLNLLRKAFPDISITARGNNLKLSGEKKDTQKAKK